MQCDVVLTERGLACTDPSSRKNIARTREHTMTTFYLVRHGDTGIKNRISGRMTGVHLNETGRRQAERLAERFTGIAVESLYSSPVERAVETAQPIAQNLDLTIQIAEAVSEIDYGEWTGKSFDELSLDSGWQSFNVFRSGAQVPGGENILQVQRRFVGWMENVRRDHADGRIVVVSHQDPIKAVVTYYAGIHIDMFSRFDISNASVTVIRLNDRDASLITLNNVGVLPM
jgi:probable phosphomutase (TIGR03848 family)